MRAPIVSSILLLALPLLAAASPARYDSAYQLRARDVAYYEERALQAREALVETAIENEVQRRVDVAIEQRDAEAEAYAAADAEPEPSAEADGGNRAEIEKREPEPKPEPEPETTVEKRQESRLWRRRGGGWGRRLGRDL